MYNVVYFCCRRDSE